jgi:hypothetical protein
MEPLLGKHIQTGMHATMEELCFLCVVHAKEDIRISTVQFESVIIDQNLGSWQSKELDCDKKTV